jgi:alpha-glucosidase
VHDSNTGRPWWQDAVVYQVYLRSFADGNGDGIGDLAGLRRRLDHVAALGVDGIWLNPCYPSPQRDHGYDIADYTDIDPDYGTLDDFDGLLRDAHARGLKVLLDLVANHCSVEHAWFQEAVRAPTGSPARDRFVFRPGRGEGGTQPPNNWQSVFGGPAWTRLDDGTGDWYLHLFDASQPDFNWRNADVRAYFEGVLRFWFARGVDGFRLDVAHGLLKATELPDWPEVNGAPTYNAHMWNQPEVHQIYRRWREIAEEYGPKLFIGEVWVPDPAELAAYLRHDELHQVFFFDLLGRPWDAGHYRETIDKGLATCGPRPTWTLANHDVPRAVTRLGTRLPADVDRSDVMSVARARGPLDLTAGDRRARAALLLLLALPGSVYVYQGEELGLPEVLELPPEARQDPIWTRSNGAEPGRDGCRVPLPWTADAPSFGFSPSGSTARPWLPQPDWFAKFAAETLADDADSILNLHRRSLAVRRRDWVPAGERLTWLDTGDPQVLAFARGEQVCATNFGPRPYRLPPEWGTPTLASGAMPDGRLPGDTAVWLN